ncbi:MAG: hypothetical protein ACK4E3_02700 [Brevundimonas sp.]|jgi:uncharacterized membrane protein|uniref:hypothetical protein n=1 Tax=Brevundimonas sp. TaxID=1871086 RepID=UPI00391C87B0
MSALALTAALLGAALVLMALRRLIAPERFAQALAGLTIGAGFVQAAGGGHG